MARRAWWELPSRSYSTPRSWSHSVLAGWSGSSCELPKFGVGNQPLFDPLLRPGSYAVTDITPRPLDEAKKKWMRIDSTG